MLPEEIKTELLTKLIDWAMPYSPIADNSLEHINEEMTAVAKTLDDNALDTLVTIGMSEHIKDEAFYYTYGDFLFAYFRFHNTAFIHLWLSDKLEQENAYPLVAMIGHTCNPKLYPVLVGKIDFFKLSLNDKYDFLDAIGRLQNSDAITYLEKIQVTEIDPEVINDISICIGRLQS